MALPLIIADWETSLAAKIAVGGTTGTLIGNTDDDGVTIGNGTVYLTIDGNNSAKEHIKCTKTGTALSDIYSVSRQGVETSGVVREHRVGAKVIMTDYATYKNYFTAASGLSGPGASTNKAIVRWDSTAGQVLQDSPVTIDDNGSINIPLGQTYKINNVDIPIAVDASETVKGIVEEATDAEVTAGTATGSTGAKLFVTPAKLATRLPVVLAGYETLFTHPTIIKKTSTTSTGGTTYTDDAALKFDFAGSSTYTVRLKMFILSQNSSGFKARLNSTQTLSDINSSFLIQYGGSGGIFTSTSFSKSQESADTDAHLYDRAVSSNQRLDGTLIIDTTFTTGTAGTFSVQWACNGGVGNNASVLLGSTLEYTKIA